MGPRAPKMLYRSHICRATGPGAGQLHSPEGLIPQVGLVTYQEPEEVAAGIWVVEAAAKNELWQEVVDAVNAVGGCSMTEEVVKKSCIIIRLTGVKMSQPDFIVANRHGNASLVCDYLAPDNVMELRFSLLKKSVNQMIEICAFSFSTNYEQATISKAIHCTGVPGPKNVTLHISGLQAEDTGTYFCKLEVMYPPPYWTKEGNGTLIYVSDLISECAQSSEPPEFSMNEWGLLAICAFTFLYSMLVTCILLFRKQRKRRWDTGFYEKMLQMDSVQSKNYSPYYIRIN
ncbi:cytotoxic T-lymphocyte protein 4 [Pelodytes ibericus]